MLRTLVMLGTLAATTLAGLWACEPAVAADAPKEKARVVVMYFHRTQRCPTCLKMGNYAEEAVKVGFPKEIAEKKVSFHFVDFQDEKNAAYTKAYGITGPALIVAKATGKKATQFKDLTEIWSKSNEKDAFLDYVRENVREYLK